MVPDWTTGRRCRARRKADRKKGPSKELTIFYAVHRGHIRGIYHDWPQCQAQVHKFPDSLYQAFDNYEEAHIFVETGNFVATPPVCYAVKKGHRAGIYTDWSLCLAQLKGFSGPVFQKFSSKTAKTEAEMYLYGRILVPDRVAPLKTVPVTTPRNARLSDPEAHTADADVFIYDWVDKGDRAADHGRWAGVYFGGESNMNCEFRILKKGKSQIGALLMAAVRAAKRARKEGLNFIDIYSIRESALVKMVAEFMEMEEKPKGCPYAEHLRWLWPYRDMLPWFYVRKHGNRLVGLPTSIPNTVANLDEIFAGLRLD